METLSVRNEEDLTIDNYVFEKAQSSKYSGVTTTRNNDWNTKIISGLLKVERTFFALIKVFQVKTILYRNKSTPVHEYCNVNLWVWSMDDDSANWTKIQILWE